MYYVYYWTIDDEMLCIESEDHPTYIGDSEVRFNPMPHVISVFSCVECGKLCIAGLWTYQRHDALAYDKFINNMNNIKGTRNDILVRALKEYIT